MKLLTLSSFADAPACASRIETVAVAEGESIGLTCRVDAYPVDDLRFTWYFNNTLDTVEVDNDRVTITGSQSVLEYTPKTSRDYGTLSCWASNTVGTQSEPCRFIVVEAGRWSFTLFLFNPLTPMWLERILKKLYR